MSAESVADYYAMLLARLCVFPLADTVLLRELAAISSLLAVPGGMCIVAEGEESDAIYVVVAGIFAAYKGAEGGREFLLGRIGVGEIIGEIGFITGERRTASVRALRDSEVLRLAKTDLETLTARRPGVLFAMCATLVRRLQAAQALAHPPARSRSFCLVPNDTLIDVKATARQFAAALKTFGKAVVVIKEQAVGHSPGWFTELELNSDFIFFLADGDVSPWTKFCLRQCDSVLLLARGEAEAAARPELAPESGLVAKGIPLELLLLWRDGIAPGRTAAWLASVKPRAHYHLRSSADVTRAARLIAGRGVGLVLSGGGARGLAHVGAISALKHGGVDIDAIGGTSIGAVIAALFALERDPAELARSFVDEFASVRLRDFAIPRVALFSERKFSRTLGRWFGELRIEESPIPFFCVTANLTHGRANVHRDGRFATWLRASTAIPGVFPPVIENDEVHVDGGILNNLPTNFMREFGVGALIAQDVGTEFDGPWRYDAEPVTRADGKARPPSLLELLWRVGSIGGSQAEEAARRDCDVMLRPAVGGIHLFGWHARERAIEAGYRAVIERLPEIRAAIDRPS